MMSSADMASGRTGLCSWAPSSECKGCPLEGRLMCRFEPQDLRAFLIGILPFGVAAVGGMIRGGYGWFALLWFAYSLFFFFVWEARVLCSHCPFWAGEGRILRCHANYGVIKLWGSRPGPMSRAEQAQFVAGALVLGGLPFAFLLLGSQYLLALVALAGAVSAGYGLLRNDCSRCVNFSCPANRVPKPTVDAYLRRNPEMREAWEKSGYLLGE